MSYDKSKAKHWLYNTNLKTLLNDMFGSINDQDGLVILNNPALKIGTDTSKVKFEDFHYCKEGVLTKVSSSEEDFTATDHDIAAHATNEKEAIFTVYLNADGDGALEMGEIATAPEAVAPATPAGGIKIGEVKVKVDAGSTDFDAGSDALSDGHLTVTYTNKAELPQEIADYGSKYWLHWINLYSLLSPMNDMLIREDEIRVIARPVLAEGTSAPTKLKHSGFDYVKNGVYGTVDGGEVELSAGDHDIANDESKAQEATYLVSFDGSDVVITRGAIADEDSAAPDLPSGHGRVGTFKIVVAAGSTPFTAETDDLDDTHTTPTFADNISSPTDDYSLDVKGKHYLYQVNLYNVIEPMISHVNAKKNSFTLGSPELARGSNTARMAHGAFTIVRNGVPSAVSAESTGVALTATTHNIAEDKEAAFNVYLDASNAVKFAMGDTVDADAGAVAADTPENGFKIGEMKIVNKSSGTFTADTTALNATGITTTFTNKIDVLEKF